MRTKNEGNRFFNSCHSMVNISWPSLLINVFVSPIIFFAMHLTHMFRSVLIFAVVFWTYNVCMFWLFVINCWNTVLFNLTISGNNAFSTMCNVCKTWSNRSSRVQIPWDIFTRFGCYLYSTEWSWITINYWMRLNTIEKVMQIEENVIHQCGKQLPRSA